jgi:hypothetical protein
MLDTKSILRKLGSSVVYLGGPGRDLTGDRGIHKVVSVSPACRHRPPIVHYRGAFVFRSELSVLGLNP